MLVAASSLFAEQLPDPTALAALSDPPAIADAPATPAAPSQNVTINLINRLVAKGVLTQVDADELIAMAEADAATARAQAQAAKPPPLSDDTVRVTYVPEFVKKQMRDEIQQQVMAQAREENWAAPRTIPDWVTRFKLFGDVRVRYEGVYFPDGNDNTGAFPNFNSINTGAPFDVSGTVFSPQINVDEDRQRIRLRARFGMDVDLGEGFSGGIRIATGENNSPVSTNQSFGLANQAQGGNFSKYAIWLDRGFLKYELGGLPTKNLALSVGRFDNPFFSTDIIWDEDIGFDGFALQAKYEVTKGVTPFVAGGAFPIFNTDFNFSSNQPDKFESTDKWLYGGQLGVDWKINQDLNLKLAGAYYYFDDVQGKRSSPFTPLTSSDAGNTDNTRPSFAQKGNTYMALRDIVPTADNNFGTTNQFQYFGLATRFENIALTGRIDYDRFEPFRVSIVGEYVRNLAYDRGEINEFAVNNRGAITAGNQLGDFDGGETAWMIGLKVGTAALEKRWDWNTAVAYRYVESDAVVDGFTDSDFGSGGTNLRGYVVSGALALSPRVWLGIRWLSASEIGGPPYRNDILQVDVNGKF